MNQPKVAGYSPAVTVLLAIYPLWFLSNYSLLLMQLYQSLLS